MSTFTIIVAAESSRNGIGFQGNLPWSINEDMRRFRDLTLDSRTGKKNALIMGSTTWKSLKGRPFSDRINVVLSRNAKSVQRPNPTDSNFHICASLDEALETVRYISDEIFVIGGAHLFREALYHPCLRRILWTKITATNDINLDVFMPPVDWSCFRCMSTVTRTDGQFALEFQNWIRNHPNPEEQQYLDIVREVLHQGESRSDRTGVGVLTTFGKKMEFDLSSGNFPLLTTKRVFFRGVVEELLWFLRGDTNSKLLQEKGIHIWDGNASRAYLDSIGLGSRAEGDLGPVYGFQWRHFGAEYVNCFTDYEGKGVDQIANIIRQITKFPQDRRIILSAWNPADFDKMALPPCHMFSQFFVEHGHLSCQMYQRSCDLGLGVPFNIASYALLVNILAHVCQLKPGKFIYIMGDTHIYKTHITPLEEQIKRIPNFFPSLKIRESQHSRVDQLTSEVDWSKWSVDDFIVENYQPQAKINMQMAI